MTSFETLGLSRELAGVVRELGFEQPTPVQEQTIPILLKGERDMVALAQTGTGKTAAFGLPLVELVDESSKETQALIMAPTRELCMQISEDLTRFSVSVMKMNIVPVYGGTNIFEQIKRLRRGAQVIVATPGRLMDLMERGEVNITGIRYVVLDEADEMLSMGFKEDIEHILSGTPAEKKTWLFSATMPNEVRQISRQFMKDPVEITVGSRNTGNENIEHQYVLVDDRDRYESLKRIVDFTPGIFGVVFCRTKLDTQRVADHLAKDGYNAEALHGDLSQVQRDKVMKAFKEKTTQLLIATDVAARGIDVSNVTHVIHMNLPEDIEYYTHRAGRTARAGNTGISMAIVTTREEFKIRQIEKAVGAKFEKKRVPTGTEVCQKRLLTMVHHLRKVEVAEEEMAGFLPQVYSELESLSKEEVIKRFTSLEFNHFLDYYRGAKDLNAGSKNKTQPDFADRYFTGERLFINIGKMDGIDKGLMLGLICDRSHISRASVGRIDLKGAYAFVEVEKEHAAKVKQSLTDSEFRGRLIRVEITADEGGRPAPKSGGKKEGAWGKGSQRPAPSRDGERGGFRNKTQGKKKKW